MSSSSHHSHGETAPVAGASEAPWQSHYYALVAHPSDTRLLLLAAPGRAAGETGEGTWTLPGWPVGEERWYEFAAALNVQTREVLGARTAVLRLTRRESDEASHRIESVCALEVLTPDWQPPADARWATASELPSLMTSQRPAGEAPLVDLTAEAVAYLRERETGDVPAERTPWAFPGWFTDASHWMEAQLRAVGRLPVGPAEQVKAWGLSGVLRMPTAEGDVYLKAPSAYFRAEIAITEALASLLPDRVPVPIAVERERGWLLLDDVGGPLRQHVPDLRERAVVLLAEMQREAVAHVPALLARGFPNRGVLRLRRELPEIARSPYVEAELSTEELARLRVAVPRLQALCDELAAAGVPETLVHGDLHGNNVGVKDGRIRFFDLTDAAISHPFLDLVTFLPRRAKEPEVRERLIEAYLAEWQRYAPAEGLRRACVVALTLGGVFQAQSYIGILDSLETAARPEMGGATGDWLRGALKRLDELE